MAVKLQVTDNRDGSGMTAHVSNFTPGTVYQLQYRLQGKDDEWTEIDFIVNSGSFPIPNGVVNIELPTVYQFRLLGVGGPGTGEESYSAMGGTDDDDSIHYRAMLGLAARLIDANLTDIGHNVYVQLYQDEKSVVFPNMLVTAVETEQIEMMDDSSQKVLFPVVVDLCDRNDQDYTRPLRKYLRWRMNILSEFRNQPLDVNGTPRAIPGVDEVSRIHVRPRPIVDLNLPVYQNVESGFVLWCETYLDILESQ